MLWFSTRLIALLLIQIQSLPDSSTSTHLLFLLHELRHSLTSPPKNPIFHLHSNANELLGHAIYPFYYLLENFSLHMIAETFLH